MVPRIQKKEDEHFSELGYIADTFISVFPDELMVQAISYEEITPIARTQVLKYDNFKIRPESLMSTVFDVYSSIGYKQYGL